jgi:heme/copper-type cytochrome/quinol oxidase subunit 4
VKNFFADILKFGKRPYSASDIVGIGFLVSIIIGLPYIIFFANPKLIVESDVVSFLTGALMIRNNVGVDTYDLATQLSFQNQIVSPFIKENVLPFKNFAPFALPFVPLTFLTLKSAYIIFAFFNIILLGVLTYYFSKVLKKVKSYRFWFLSPFIFLPSILSVILGQLSIVLTAIYFFVYKFLKEDKSALAGIFSGLVLIKPQYAVSFPFFLLLAKNKGKFISGFLLTFGVILIAAVLLSGVESLSQYPSFLLATENASFGQRSQRMFTLSSTVFYNFPAQPLSYLDTLYINAFLYLGVFYLFIKRYKNLSLDYAFSGATIFSLLFAVHVLEHDLAILLVPVFLLMKSNELVFASLLFVLPLIVLIISPALGSVMAIIIALFLLLKKRAPRSSWERKK